MATRSTYDVVIVGGGVAGRTAAIFTARHGLSTLVCDTGESIVRRNAHLENFPGFAAGVNARHLLGLMGEQLDRAGAELAAERVTDIKRDDASFSLTAETGEQVSSSYVIAATKNEVGYLRSLDDVEIIDRGSTFVRCDERGRTGCDGLYVAGRLAGKPHQAIVSAGHGAEVGVTLLEDDERPFYHDWVAPNGYFTDRGRDLPPGCEEISAEERERRERESLQFMRDQFDELHPDPQETHPSLQD